MEDNNVHGFLSDLSALVPPVDPSVFEMASTDENPDFSRVSRNPLPMLLALELSFRLSFILTNARRS
jgi:hypothetical protein